MFKGVKYVGTIKHNILLFKNNKMVYNKKKLI